MNESILQEAERIINGPRRDSYGDPITSFENIAKMWSIIVGHEISARQVCLMMVVFKVLRENTKHSRDNMVDICGYAALGMFDE